MEIGTADQQMKGDAAGQVRLFRLDLDHGTADFSGSFLDFRDVLMHKVKNDPLPWSGHLALESATVRRPDGLELAAHVQFGAPNASPLYSLLNVEMPRWAERRLRMEGLSAAADVTLGRSLVEVKALDASGEKARIQGEYRRKGRSVTALCLVESGPFAVGLAVADGKTNWKWIRPRTWFRKQFEGSAPPRDPARGSSIPNDTPVIQR